MEMSERELKMSELQKKYKFYRVGRNAVSKNGFISDLMVFGLECPLEWYEPLDKLGQKVEEGIKRGLLPKNIKASQVKEKFNELRVYYYPYHKLVERYIREAEKEVAEIEKNNLRGKG